MSAIRKLSVANFVNRDLRSFSTYDCKINIPNVMDGFKVSQRKAIYTIHHHNKRSTVERFSSEIASFTAYHHGSGSLEGVIVGLAQDFPTSNNINFLTPIGQFGNILSPRASSGRYISVEPNANFRRWFKKEDDLVLEYEYEDGEQIEPKFFVPVVPTILFNGSSGIGTGYACKILNYNPADVVRNVLEVLNNKKQTPLVPFYKGFKGKVEKTGSSTLFTGTFERVNTTTLKITALPIGYTLDSYKVELGKLIDREIIKDYDDNSTVDGWEILVYTNRAFLASHTDEELIDKLKLTAREGENITVWGADGKIKCFDSPEELIEYFVSIRLGLYEVRRLKLIEQTLESIRWAEDKIRFIRFYLNNTELFKNTGKKDLVELLLKNDFPEYDRLLQMPMWNLTRDRIVELEKELEELRKRAQALEADTAKATYVRELKEFKLAA